LEERQHLSLLSQKPGPGRNEEYEKVVAVSTNRYEGGGWAPATGEQRTGRRKEGAYPSYILTTLMRKDLFYN